MKYIYPNLYAAMEKKDRKLFSDLQSHTMASAWAIWRDKYPEDFADTNLHTTLAEIEADVEKFIKPS